MKKTTEVSPELGTKEVKAITKEYDGYEEVREPLIDGSYVTSRQKPFLSHAETVKFMGSNNPELYFKDGKVPVSIPNALGTLLDDDTRYERQVFDESFRNYEDVLFFKHNLANIYTILVPKKYSELEIDPITKDYIDRLVRYDTRSIAFTGKGNLPSSFDKDYFGKVAQNIKQHFDKAVKSRANV